MSFLIIVFTLGLMAALFAAAVAVVAYVTGRTDKEHSVAYPLTHQGGNYKNRWVTPYNYLYDAGYRGYSVAEEREKENKKRFNKE